MSEKCTVCKGIGKIGEPPVTCFFCRGEKTINITEIMDRGQCKAEKLELLDDVITAIQQCIPYPETAHDGVITISVKDYNNFVDKINGLKSEIET